ncbi:MAG: tRNA 2-selenouridine(34) synthase MnmH [Alphaproteobacteria bacterium]|nr:MAG: tRNA 2-selenouridine(34) synthase MnmH [Alphaproteobacteria bacterium]
MPAPRPDTDDYRRLFLADVPMMDMRAPVEFARGAFPNATNLPLMTDHERETVGITYKQEGQDAAIRMGHSLVCGAVKEARVAAWKAFAEAHPEGYLYCFRGGLRSQISQQWLREAGVEYPRVRGGYKAMRRFLIDETDRLAATEDFVVIAGRTGTGKTDLLNMIPKSLDLEGLANHRGSSFGRRPGDQPEPIDFENALAVRLLKICDAHRGPVFLEDENIRIGQLALPLPIATRIGDWPMVIVEEPLEDRIEVIHRDYVTGLLAEHETAFGADGFESFAGFLTDALARVRKRLGGVGYAEISALLQGALARHRDTGDTSAHRDWIHALLSRYYDPMYDYQLGRKTQPVLMTGSRADVLAWAADRAGH